MPDLCHCRCVLSFTKVFVCGESTERSFQPLQTDRQSKTAHLSAHALPSLDHNFPINRYTACSASALATYTAFVIHISSNAEISVIFWKGGRRCREPNLGSRADGGWWLCCCGQKNSCLLTMLWAGAQMRRSSGRLYSDVLRCPHCQCNGGGIHLIWEKQQAISWLCSLPDAHSSWLLFAFCPKAQLSSPTIIRGIKHGLV